jgi:uncharacterized protein
MARPKCPRLIGEMPNTTFFKPRGIPLSNLDLITLTFDELEAIRLADLEGLYQETASEKMGISRATFGRVLESAHRKLADALLRGKAIKIEGGVVKMAQKRVFSCGACNHTWEEPFGTGRPEACPKCGSDLFSRLDAGQGRGGRRHGINCQRQQRNRIKSGKD